MACEVLDVFPPVPGWTRDSVHPRPEAGPMEGGLYAGDDPEGSELTRPIERLDQSALDEVVEVLGDAFADYPVMRFVLRESGPVYPQHLDALLRFFALARFLREEPVFGVRSGQDLAGVALLSHPDGPRSPPELAELKEHVWWELGSDARDRYEEYGIAAEPLTVRVPHVHLNMIGVRASARGSGLGRRLLDRVHRFAEEARGPEGVTLNTEDPANIALYERFGYEVLGSGDVSGEFRTWGLFRPNR